MARLAMTAMPVAMMLAVLSGCVGAGEEFGPAGLEEEASASDDVQPQPYRFEGPNESYMDRQEGGTFPLCPSGTCAQEHEVDVTDMIPARAVATLRARLEWSSGPGFTSTADLSFDGGDASVYRQQASYSQSGDLESSEGVIAMDLLLRRGADPVLLQVGRVTPGPEISWSLRVEVETNATRIPSSLPVELSIAPGQELVLGIEPTPEATSLLVYDLRDRLLSRIENPGEESLFLLPENSPPGPYVMYLRAPNLNYTIASRNASDLGLRPLGLTHSIGVYQPVTGPEPFEWEFEVERTPFYAGIYVITLVPAALPATPWTGVATLEGPAGVVIEADIAFNCGTGCSTNGAFVISDFGDPALVPGTYVARYAPDQPQPVQVAELVFQYER